MVPGFVLGGICAAGFVTMLLWVSLFLKCSTLQGQQCLEDTLDNHFSLKLCFHPGCIAFFSALALLCTLHGPLHPIQDTDSTVSQCSVELVSRVRFRDPLMSWWWRSCEQVERRGGASVGPCSPFLLQICVRCCRRKRLARVPAAAETQFLTAGGYAASTPPTFLQFKYGAWSFYAGQGTLMHAL